MSGPTPDAITLDDFRSILSRYPSILPCLTTPRTTPPLPELDSLRRTELPKKVASRTPPHITADELLSILHCKLKRGVFRPTLPKLVASNTESLVVEATTTAFECLEDGVTLDAVMKGLKELCKLKGIGPATASYVLAVAGKGDVPVFSDEGYAWVMQTGEGRGAKLKYDEKEYKRFAERAREVAERLGATAEEVEMVGWVVGKEAQGIGSGAGANAEEAMSGKTGNVETVNADEEDVGKATESGRKKRKAPSKDEDKRAKKGRDTKAEPEPQEEKEVPSRRVLRSRKAKE